jgi:hypothetical protein
LHRPGPTGLETPVILDSTHDSNTTCVSPARIFALLNGPGKRRRSWKSLRRRLKSLVGTSPRRFGGPSSSCHLSIAKGSTRGNSRTLLIPLDPNLTLTRTQCPATVGKAGNRKPVVYAEFCKPLQPSATLDRTLVMSRSAVRVRSSALFLTCKYRKKVECPARSTGGLAAVGQQ